MAATTDRAKLLKTVAATCFGTVIEWYDFAVYTQLTPVLSKVFFPASTPWMATFSIWAVFAVSFFARPLGAVLFAHLGDTKGRGVCLLLTVLTMGVPTMMIGFLPTYQHIGVAAPIFLAVLRFIQGLSMGGEFGAAMVYLFEIAEPAWKSRAASLGYVSLGTGMILGNLITLAVVSAVTPEDVLVWGWRVPFLLAFLTAEAAVVLRWNMLESLEFSTSKQQLNQLYKQRSLRRQCSLRQQYLPPAPTPAPAAGAAAASAAASSSNPGATPPAAAHAAGEARRRDAGAGKDAGAMKDVDVDADVDIMDADVDVEAAGAEPKREKHYVPLLLLVKFYWPQLLLQICAAAGSSVWFYIGTSWAGTFFVKALGIPEALALWMNITGMAIFAACAPVAGWWADKGYGRLTLSMALCFVLACVAVPMFLGFGTKRMAVCWAIQAAILASDGILAGLLPSTFALLYPAGVRVSGFNCAFGLTMMFFGGMTPMILTAIQASTGSLFIGPGIFAACLSLLQVVAGGAIMWRQPHVNKGSTYPQRA